MTDRRLIDTNIIIRHLTQDFPAHAAIAGKLFEASDRGELMLIILPEVLAESVYVLESFYKQSRIQIASALEILLTGVGVVIEDLKVHLNALRRYSGNSLHFIDCILAASGEASGCSIASFDAGLKKVRGLKIDVSTDADKS